MSDDAEGIDELRILTQDPETGLWVDLEPEPFYAPPRFRSVLWAWLRRKPKPEWRAVDSDPNPNERRWRRG